MAGPQRMTRTDDTAWLQGAADAFAAVMTDRTGKKWIGVVTDREGTTGDHSSQPPASRPIEAKPER